MMQYDQCSEANTTLFCSLDIQGAFYSVIRELLMPVGTSMEALEELIDNIGVPIQFQSALETLLQQPAMLHNVLADKHLLSSVTEAFSSTWYSMHHTQSVVQARLGVAPGDQLADVVYNTIYQSSLRSKQ